MRGAPADPDEPAELTSYGWDEANAWRTSQGPQADPAQVQMSYDGLGRMASYAAPGKSATYTYDAEGQRTRSTVTAGGVTTTTTYAYEGITLLALTATQGASSWRIDYLTDEEGVPYGGVYRSPASSTSPTYFTMVTTDRGDVALLCDASGAAFAAYRYDAWGAPLGAGNHATGVWTQGTSLVTSTLAGQIATRQVLRYAGYAYDAESGFSYCSARSYDPATRQWTSADPAKADGEESAYRYCSGDPVGGTDPTGLHYAVNTSTEAANGLVRLRLEVHYNETPLKKGNGMFGVQFVRMKVRATRLDSDYRLSRVNARYSMGTHGHCNHDGGDYKPGWHPHGERWRIPNRGPIKSGTLYARTPAGVNNHYNVLVTQQIDDVSNWVVRAVLTYSHTKTGDKYRLPSRWVWDSHSVNANP